MLSRTTVDGGGGNTESRCSTCGTDNNVVVKDGLNICLICLVGSLRVQGVELNFSVTKLSTVLNSISVFANMMRDSSFQGILLREVCKDYGDRVLVTSRTEGLIIDLKNDKWSFACVLMTSKGHWTHRVNDYHVSFDFINKSFLCYRSNSVKTRDQLVAEGINPNPGPPSSGDDFPEFQEDTSRMLSRCLGSSPGGKTVVTTSTVATYDLTVPVKQIKAKEVDLQKNPRGEVSEVKERDPVWELIQCVMLNVVGDPYKHLLEQNPYAVLIGLGTDEMTYQGSVDDPSLGKVGEPIWGGRKREQRKKQSGERNEAKHQRFFQSVTGDGITTAPAEKVETVSRSEENFDSKRVTQAIVGSDAAARQIAKRLAFSGKGCPWRRALGWRLVGDHEIGFVNKVEKHLLCFTSLALARGGNILFFKDLFGIVDQSDIFQVLTILSALPDTSDWNTRGKGFLEKLNAEGSTALCSSFSDDTEYQKYLSSARPRLMHAYNGNSVPGVTAFLGRFFLHTPSTSDVYHSVEISPYVQTLANAFSINVCWFSDYTDSVASTNQCLAIANVLTPDGHGLDGYTWFNTFDTFDTFTQPLTFSEPAFFSNVIVVPFGNLADVNIANQRSEFNPSCRNVTDPLFTFNFQPTLPDQSQVMWWHFAFRVIYNSDPGDWHWWVYVNATITSQTSLIGIEDVVTPIDVLADLVLNYWPSSIWNTVISEGVGELIGIVASNVYSIALDFSLDTSPNWSWVPGVASFVSMLVAVMPNSPTPEFTLFGMTTNWSRRTRAAYQLANAVAKPVFKIIKVWSSSDFGSSNEATTLTSVVDTSIPSGSQLRWYHSQTNICQIFNVLVKAAAQIFIPATTMMLLGENMKGMSQKERNKLVHSLNGNIMRAGGVPEGNIYPLDKADKGLDVALLSNRFSSMDNSSQLSVSQINNVVGQRLVNTIPNAAQQSIPFTVWNHILREPWDDGNNAYVANPHRLPQPNNVALVLQNYNLVETKEYSAALNRWEAPISVTGRYPTLSTGGFDVNDVFLISKRKAGAGWNTEAMFVKWWLYFLRAKEFEANSCADFHFLNGQHQNIVGTNRAANPGFEVIDMGNPAPGTTIIFGEDCGCAAAPPDPVFPYQPEHGTFSLHLELSTVPSDATLIVIPKEFFLGGVEAGVIIALMLLLVSPFPAFPGLMNYTQNNVVHTVWDSGFCNAIGGETSIAFLLPRERAQLPAQPNAGQWNLNFGGAIQSGLTAVHGMAANTLLDITTPGGPVLYSITSFIYSWLYGSNAQDIITMLAVVPTLPIFCTQAQLDCALQIAVMLRYRVTRPLVSPQATTHIPYANHLHIWGHGIMDLRGIARRVMQGNLPLAPNGPNDYFLATMNWSAWNNVMLQNYDIVGQPRMMNIHSTDLVDRQDAVSCCLILAQMFACVFDTMGQIWGCSVRLLSSIHARAQIGFVGQRKKIVEMFYNSKAVGNTGFRDLFAQLWGSKVQACLLYNSSGVWQCDPFNRWSLASINPTTQAQWLSGFDVGQQVARVEMLPRFVNDATYALLAFRPRPGFELAPFGGDAYAYRGTTQGGKVIQMLVAGQIWLSYYSSYANSQFNAIPAPESEVEVTAHDYWNRKLYEDACAMGQMVVQLIDQNAGVQLIAQGDWLMLPRAGYGAANNNASIVTSRIRGQYAYVDVSTVRLLFAQGNFGADLCEGRLALQFPQIVTGTEMVQVLPGRGGVVFKSEIVTSDSGVAADGSVEKMVGAGNGLDSVGTPATGSQSLTQ